MTQLGINSTRKTQSPELDTIGVRPPWTGDPCTSLIEVKEVSNPGILEVVTISGHVGRIAQSRVYDFIKEKGSLLPRTLSLAHLAWMLENPGQVQMEGHVSAVRGWASVSFSHELDTFLVPVANLDLGCLSWSTLDLECRAEAGVVARKSKTH